MPIPQDCTAFPPHSQRSLTKEKAAKGETATGNSTKPEENWVDKTAPEIARVYPGLQHCFRGKPITSPLWVSRRNLWHPSNLPVTLDASTSGASSTDNKPGTASASLCCRNFAQDPSLSTRNVPKTITSKSNAGLGHQLYHSYLAVASLESLKSLAKINDHDG